MRAHCPGTPLRPTPPPERRATPRRRGKEAARAQAPLRRLPTAHSTSSARKSLTLVKVGPGLTRSPSAEKKL